MGTGSPSLRLRCLVRSWPLAAVTFDRLDTTAMEGATDHVALDMDRRADAAAVNAIARGSQHITMRAISHGDLPDGRCVGLDPAALRGQEARSALSAARVPAALFRSHQPACPTEGGWMRARVAGEDQPTATLPLHRLCDCRRPTYRQVHARRTERHRPVGENRVGLRKIRRVSRCEISQAGRDALA
jgi:hypothetical protein